MSGPNQESPIRAEYGFHMQKAVDQRNKYDLVRACLGNISSLLLVLTAFYFGLQGVTVICDAWVEVENTRHAMQIQEGAKTQQASLSR